MKITHRKENPQLVKLIQDLKAMSREHKAPIWRTVAEKLERSDRLWSEVNVSRIARFAKEGEMLVVPGKLLGSGSISFPVTVAVFKTSEQARKKIAAAGGRTVTIGELVSSNPSGAGVRIMG